MVEIDVEGEVEVAVEVRFFAAAADATGCEEETLKVAAPATLGSLRSLLGARYGAGLERVMAAGSFLVDGVVRRDPDVPVGARVDVLPPFAGG